MLSLYSRLAGHWDELFPPDDERIQYLRDYSGLRKGSRVIDVGCGSGRTALSLAEMGCDVLATDPDEEMIRSGRELSGSGIVFRSIGMIETLEDYPPGRADLLICLGNTLPHLDGPDELRRMLGLSARSLAPGGRFLVQFLNYDRIRNAGVVIMPDLTAGTLLFRRRQEYDPTDNRVRFVTEVQDGDNREERTSLMYPIMPGELDHLAAEAGFSVESRGSSWNRDALVPESPWLYTQYRKDTE